MGAVDTYLRTQADPPHRMTATDARGRTPADNFTDLKRECDEHGNPVTSFWLGYGDKGDADVWFIVTAHDFHLPDHHPYGPKVRILGEGIDAARVRGAVAEAVDRAKAAQPEVIPPPPPLDGAKEVTAEPAKPQRVYSARERVEIDPDRAWVVFDLADAVARSALNGDIQSEVTITDDRGEFTSGDVHSARVHWEKDRRPVSRMRIWYGVTQRDATRPHIYCDNLDSGVPKLVPPNLNVHVTSAVFEEAERLAKRIIAVADAKAPEKEQEPGLAGDPGNRVALPSSDSVSPSPSLATPPAQPQPWWTRALNHQYSVQIIGGIIAGVVLLAITLALT
jgi:hypothetical protein